MVIHSDNGVLDYLFQPSLCARCKLSNHIEIKLSNQILQIILRLL